MINQVNNNQGDVNNNFADRVVPYSTWRHAKGGLYTVLGLALDSTNGPGEGTPYVVYVSHAYGQMRCRKAEEFFDGRFVRVV